MIHVISKRKLIKNVHKISLPQSHLIIYSLPNSLSFIPNSAKAEFLHCQIQADVAIVSTVTFCGGLLWAGDSNLSLIPKYCVSSFHFSSFANCWLLQTDKQVINITNSLSRTCNSLFNTKRNSSLWQTCSFHPFTVFNGSEISSSFPSLSLMPQSWKHACIQFQVRHHEG